jgi:hypothetical protein
MSFAPLGKVVVVKPFLPTQRGIPGQQLELAPKLTRIRLLSRFAIAVRQTSPSDGSGNSLDSLADKAFTRPGGSIRRGANRFCGDGR